MNALSWFYSLPSSPPSLELGECQPCEGSGRIPRGESGAYYRDGEQYDAPGEEICEQCNGTGKA